MGAGCRLFSEHDMQSTAEKKVKWETGLESHDCSSDHIKVSLSLRSDAT